MQMLLRRRHRCVCFLTYFAAALFVLSQAFQNGLPQRNQLKTSRSLQRGAKSRDIRKHMLTHEPENDLNILERQLDLLDARKLSRLKQIESGQWHRGKVELVLARYEEDVSWARMYSTIATVYNKGKSRVFIDRADAVARGARVVDLDNVGRESHSLLVHIVNNYDKNASGLDVGPKHRWPGLAELTVFAHGSPPSRGYRGADNGGGHMLGNVSLHDYILQDDGRFTFTSAMRLTDAAHIIRHGYNFGSIDRDEALQACPYMSLDVPGSYEARFPFCDPNHALNLCQLIGSLCRDEGISEAINVSGSTLPGLCSPLGFWQRWVRLPRPKHDVVFFAQGTVFSFTREQVRKRPKSYYESLLRAAAGTEYSFTLSNRSEERKDYGRGSATGSSTGFFLEWFWYYVLTSEFPSCPTSGKEFDFATTVDFTRT